MITVGIDIGKEKHVAGAYRPRDGRVVLADLPGDLLQRQAVSQPMLDLQTFRALPPLAD